MKTPQVKPDWPTGIYNGRTVATKVRSPVDTVVYQIVFKTWGYDGSTTQQFEEPVYRSYEEAKKRLAFLKDHVDPNDFNLSIEETVRDR
jgi:hypothetical protein